MDKTAETQDSLGLQMEVNICYTNINCRSNSGNFLTGRVMQNIVLIIGSVFILHNKLGFILKDAGEIHSEHPFLALKLIFPW